jgi:hypothetical protein
MIKRLTTILLLLSFGVFPATAHACNIASLICQTLGQEEENCCTEGECHMDMSKMSKEQTDDNQQCLCAFSGEKKSSGIIASAPNFPVLTDSEKSFLPKISTAENLPAEIFYSSIPHHKSNQTYLKNSCFRL